ncbi:glycosidase [Nitritalea halalkaliphila LW7]|uniref:Glycosidase n=2 Tax=Nitritalea TaxID=1187887 RepID=I5C2G1_9BACT|nr:glycosidase [Nitritalea halalkaliphila LW7]
MNGGAFDGGQLSTEERELRAYYRKLLQLTLKEPAFSGSYASLHGFNRQHTKWYNDRVYSFVRWQGEERILVVSNFSASDSYGFELQLPEELVRTWAWKPGTYAVEELLEGVSMPALQVEDRATIRVDLAPLQSLVLRLPA